MGRLLRNLLASLLLPFVLLTAALLALNTDPGRRLVVRGLAEVSGGQVIAAGLSGTLPFSPRLERLEIHDGQGAWLLIENAVLVIDARGLLRGELAVQSLGAGEMVLTRLPDRAQDSAIPIRVPLAVSVARLEIGALDLGQALPGAPRLAIQGGGSLAGAGDGELDLAVEALERGDRYRLRAAAVAGQTRAGLVVRETPGGLFEAVARAAGITLPEDLGTWALDASAAGPLDALSVNASLNAGPLRAATDGVLDLDSRTVTGLRLSAELPAMTLERGTRLRIAWRGIQLAAQLSGSLQAPRGSARVEAQGLAAGTLSADRLVATAEGDGRRLRFGADVEGLRTPLDLPGSAATAPLRISGDLVPVDATLPLRIGIEHPLLRLAASAELTSRTARAALSLPDLSAFNAPAGTPLAGSAEMLLTGGALEPAWLETMGEVHLTKGPEPLPRLLGPAAGFAASLRQADRGWWIDSGRFDGANVQAGVQGGIAVDRLALGWSLALPDLAAVVPGWSGRVQAVGGIAGPATAPELVADLTADSAQGHVSGRLGARLAGPSATVDLGGQWTGQSVEVRLAVGRTADGELGLSLGESRWASVTATGDLHLPIGAALPRGEIRFNAERLADLTPLLSLLFPADSADPMLAGRLATRLTLTDAGVASLKAEGDALRLPGSVAVGSLQLDAQVTEPLGRAEIAATARLDGLKIEPVAGNLTMTARGPIAALDFNLDSALSTPVGATRLSAAARADAPGRRLTLQRLEAQALGETLRLAAPAVLDLAGGLAVDRLRLSLGQGSIEVAGRAAPRLDLDATLTRLPLDLARLAAPELPLSGSLDARIRLDGSLDAPTGSVRAEASGVRLTEGAWRSMPPGLMTISASLGPRATEIDARTRIASLADLRARGTIGGTLRAPGSLALKTNGQIDLTLLDPLLAGGGRQVRGQARLDANVAGTAAAPRLDGRLGLADGAFWDRRLGLALTDIKGRLALSGDRMRVERFTARAGAGTLTLEGDVGVLASGLPLDLRLVARGASPIQSDLVSAQGDADLRLQGRAAEALTASGTISLSRAEVRLPERLPTAIAVLEVRERGTRSHPPRSERAAAGSALSPKVALDLMLSAPRAVYVRGRGVDAELGGQVRFRGTLDAPELSGGFDLLRGEYELVGQTLRFDRGRLGFDGAAGLDPTLDLEARATAAGSTAILNLLGTATAPRIELRGEPELPEDEVLSRLLFGVAGGRLSGLQAARLGMAAASLAGLETGKGFARARPGAHRTGAGPLVDRHRPAGRCGPRGRALSLGAGLSGGPAGGPRG